MFEQRWYLNEENRGDGLKQGGCFVRIRESREPINPSSNYRDQNGPAQMSTKQI